MRAWAGGHAAAHLRVARLQPDRGAEPVRHHVLGRHDGAVAERHAAALERVGLDRVGRHLRAPALEAEVEQGEQQPTERGHEQDEGGVGVAQDAEPVRGARPERE